VLCQHFSAWIVRTRSTHSKPANQTAKDLPHFRPCASTPVPQDSTQHVTGGISANQKRPPRNRKNRRSSSSFDVWNDTTSIGELAATHDGVNWDTGPPQPLNAFQVIVAVPDEPSCLLLVLALGGVVLGRWAGTNYAEPRRIAHAATLCRCLFDWWFESKRRGNMEN
jgi:hypothetical protein